MHGGGGGDPPGLPEGGAGAIQGLHGIHWDSPHGGPPPLLLTTLDTQTLSIERGLYCKLLLPVYLLVMYVQVVILFYSPEYI